MKQYASIDDTVYFWFASNDTSGSGNDGATPAADVRLAGAAADAAPVYSPTPVLLTAAGYPPGAYEVAITASAANGFAADNTYAVFCTLAVDAQNPTGFVGSFDTMPVQANAIEIESADPTDTIRDSVVDDANRIDASALNTLSGHDPGATIAKAGDAMNLAADAIKAVSYDETTAWPIIATDTGATQIARVGADGDTLETLSDQIDDVPTAAENTNNWETQSQADPTGFHVNVLEIGGIGQTANDNGADLNTLLDRITAARAGYFDNLNGHVAQTGDSFAIVNDGTHGNAALETLVDEIETILKNATYGNSALQVLLADVPTTAEFNARTLLAANYFDPSVDDVTVTAATINAIIDEVIGDAVHATPNSMGAMIHAIYCRMMQKRTATTAAEVAYKLDDVTPLKTFILTDDDVTVTRV